MKKKIIITIAGVLIVLAGVLLINFYPIFFMKSLDTQTIEGTNQDEVKFLEDEEDILIGDMQVKCFATPGHTMGSVSYLINKSYLFTGDALRLKENEFTLHPFTMDKEKAQKSIEKISDIEADNLLVITAHYGCISILYE